MKKINQINIKYASLEAYIENEFTNVIEGFKSKLSSLTEDDLKFLANLKNNKSAFDQIYKQYEPSGKISRITKTISKNLDVFIILENWCGSSVANVPLVVKILETLPNVKIHFVPRDKNLAFMDLYLTNEKRSIPKIIAFDENDNEIFIWGSASKMQEEFAEILKKQNLAFPEFIREMKIWFKENNINAIETDFIELLDNLKKLENWT